jgi:hypothetical protein
VELSEQIAQEACIEVDSRLKARTPLQRTAIDATLSALRSA